ncbi:RNA polymerase sigma factor [Streptomyces sp. NPDC051940]|uniref:RNA polymerase sigma factor n=1 Tax=Streptomyces sp. NPDC051940 TaxID=3155675 RepID=UPI00341564DF
MAVEPGVRLLVGADRRPEEESGAESDALVIARSRDEPEVFAVLFDRHADAVHRYAARRLGSEVADDLMAETFTTAFQQRHRYDDGRADARPWLFGIATNLVARHRRAEARRFKALARMPAPAEHDEAVADRVVARVSAAGAGRELAAALAGLPARHRDVLLLVAWGDLGYEEVAQALGVPVGTVRSRLHRARGKLRDALGGSDPSALREVSGHE